MDDLRKWLAASAQHGLADGPFRFRHMRGLHFAKLFLLEQTADLESRPIPASLVLMTEVDAPLHRHPLSAIRRPAGSSGRRKVRAAVQKYPAHSSGARAVVVQRLPMRTI